MRHLLSNPPLQKINLFSITKTILFMLFRKIFMVCYKNYRLHKYGVWTKYRLFYLTAGITHTV